MKLDDIGPSLSPIVHPTTALWGLPLNYTDYNKLMKGFQPMSMDDKWLCRADNPDSHGNAAVHMYRSWTGQEQISLIITAGNFNEIKANDWANIIKISWNEKEQEHLVTEGEAKNLAINICKRILDCHMDNTSPMV